MAGIATLKDIAEKAGVSVAAVSRVLAQDKTFSATNATRQLILAAAQELQYTPPARRGQQAPAMALVMLYTEQEELEDPYYLSVRASARREGFANGYRISEHFAPHGPRALAGLKGVAGAVVIGSSFRLGAQLKGQLRKAGLPVVLADFWADQPAWDSVYVDFRQAVSLVMGHFEKLGILRVGYLGAREHTAAGVVIEDLRERYYVENRRMVGRFNEEDVYIGEGVGCDEGYALMQRAIERGNLPQGFFIANDSLAIGALKALHEAGIPVPGRVAVVGHNDIPAAAYLSPPLSTVRARTDMIGTFAVRLLMDRMANERDVGVHVVVPCTLMERESSTGKKG